MITRKKLRLQSWDYSENGWYFATICTFKKVNWFGKIENEEMKLSEVGNIVNEEWLKTAVMRKDIFLDEYVIMPNHFHGILIIDRESNAASVGSHCNVTLPVDSRFGPQKDNLSSIIRGFKGSCTNRIKRLGYTNFQWQSRFYDHIITNDKDLSNIRDYITNNPLKWQFDRENPDSLWE